VNRHKLGRCLLNALVPNPDEVLLVPATELVARDEVSEVVLVLRHLVLDVKRTEENVDAHVEGSESELELEAFEDGVDEEAVRLRGVGIGTVD